MQNTITTMAISKKAVATVAMLVAALLVCASACVGTAHASQALKLSAQVTMPVTSYTYDPWTPVKVYPKAVRLADGTELAIGADYTVSHKNANKAGQATMYIKLNPNSDTLRRKIGATAVRKAAVKKISVPYWIDKADISAAEVKTPPDQTYNGKAKKPAVTVKYNGKALKKGRDYTVSYKNNKKPGVARVTIKGKGNYKGTIITTFIIKQTTSNKNKPNIKSKATVSASSKAKKMATLADKDFKKSTERGGAKYWKAAGFQGRVEWSALYVSYYANKAGMVKNKTYPRKNNGVAYEIYKYMKSKTNAKIYKNDGTHKPSKGSLVFLGKGQYGMCHMGIVISSTKNTMTVLEGNYADEVVKNTYNLGTTWSYIVVPR